MFKHVQERVWAFDAEWVPDPHTGRMVYNSASADLRILVQRGVATGVCAPGFAQRPDKPWEGVDYFAGNDWHVDLIDTLGGRDRSRPSLHEMATVCGIPGKFYESGGDVADMWMAGEVARIVAYNELDALTTYLLWLRVAFFAGLSGRMDPTAAILSIIPHIGVQPPSVK